ncbi:miniconductance mechanosensitive channel [Dethiosulfatibacter aminovorans DSM 17477]|uniref:Miniconductance mechanosensitive channel n=1 Tax=Dethiosulfatibacter aminovorans DSM 17477 TaxID=1121476 RepID=A0A1M6LNR7_9FIRM|nr:mechanosensitive ion channel family protein [Dethiosulfatibacter aminovorans]SHJ72851.1 miniconductance mechanosensitive channel [Dethiosulfatibacter aminovorans DSM 17477]
MYELINHFLEEIWGSAMSRAAISAISYASSALIVFILCIFVDRITKGIIIRNVKRIVDKSKNTLDEVFYEKRVFHSLGHIAPGLVVYVFSNSFGDLHDIVKKLAFSYIVAIVLVSIFRSIDAIVAIYNRFDIAKGRPIKGVMQIVKIVVAVLGIGVIFVIFIGSTVATVLLGSIGGLSAVVLLIFRDSILGFVAGLQLSAGELLSIGDWLEMPKYGADGEVTDISLTKITVRNWDKTYTNIPAYRFLEDSFKNWKGMTQAGGRRIKRSLNIDLGTIGFVTEEEMKKLAGEGFIDEVQCEGKHTNVGLFRKYVEDYLRKNPNIYSEDFTLMVRQLPAGEHGLPLEIYCFVNDTAWVNYEGIQADIFDHIIATVPEFGLRIYQNPSGNDIKSMKVESA